LQGYFTRFAVSAAALKALNTWFGPPGHPPLRQISLGGVVQLPVAGKKGQTSLAPLYDVRLYPTNLLTQLPRLQRTLSSPPAWLLKQLTGPPSAC
jgi:hypothetical protein